MEIEDCRQHNCVNLKESKVNTCNLMDCPVEMVTKCYILNDIPNIF